MIATENFYKKILYDISSGVIYLQKGKILYANPSALEILDKKESELVDKLFAESFFDYSENDDFNQMLLEVIYDSNRKHEKIVQYFNGKDFKNLHIRTSSVKFSSELIGIIILLDDVTELMKLRGIALDLEKIKEINRQLKQNAETDKLTGLLNKTTFENFCSEYLKKIPAAEISALFVIDLDNFKKANDTRGHQFGDLILKNFSERLKEIFTAEDLIGRFGGDEFVILLKKVSGEEFAIKKARAVIKMARDSFDKELELSASVGVAIFSGEEKNYSKIFSVADKSVYIVKNQGKNGFSINEQQKQTWSEKFC